MHYPDRLFSSIIVNYCNLKSRMVWLGFWKNNVSNLPFLAILALTMQDRQILLYYYR